MSRREPAVRQYNVGAAKARLSRLVREALLGEEVIISKDNKPLVRLVPLAPRQSAARTPGSAKGRVSMSQDFDRIPEDFADYT
jgi:prevent-host-death family protein